MTAANTYAERLTGALARAFDAEWPQLEQAAELVATSIGTGGVTHVFGSGHSQLVANELMFRAGGLAAIRAIIDAGVAPSQPEQAGLIERLPGYGATIVATADVRPGEVCFVVSNSGINPVPIEVAAGLRDRGLTVVAVTSVTHSTQAQSRDTGNRRLLDEVDLVIDTHVETGDALVEMPSHHRMGPASTIVASALLHAAIVRAAELLEVSGAKAPVVVTQNLGNADGTNEAVVGAYRDRLRGGHG